MIHNQGFINAMNARCKMMSASATVNGIDYTDDNIVSINPYYEGDLLCSVMRCCTIEIQFDEEIDSSTVTALRGKIVESAKIGAKQNDDDFSFIDFGKYTIYSAEYREANNSVYLTCYDSMLDAMVPYNIEVSDAMTVKELLLLICERLGWTLADVEFANEDKLITAEALNSYLSISAIGDEAGDSSYTFRDVLDDIAELIGGNLIFKTDGLLYPLYPQAITEDNQIITLSADNQKEISFYDQFGPINSVSLVSTESANTVILDDKDSIADNGVCQITIKDNPLINSNRENFIGGIFNKLKGLYYTPFDFTSFGFGYIEFGDIFNLEDSKGNVKRSIMLSDSFLASLTVQETSSAKAYSADSDTNYSVAAPIDKVKIEIKRLQNASTKLNERIEDAEAAISKTIDGHAVLVNLEYDTDTGRYYVGDGEADTFIVSENPSVSTKNEPEDWNTGRVIRINYNGMAVSTTGIGGPYSDFAIYYDEERKKYLVNADDIAVGTLQGIKAILEKGEIGGWLIGRTDTDDLKIWSRMEGITAFGYQKGAVEVNFKNDQANDIDKKILYANAFEKGYGSAEGMLEDDAHKTEIFYIRRNGEAMFQFLIAPRIYAATQITSDNITAYSSLSSPLVYSELIRSPSDAVRIEDNDKKGVNIGTDTHINDSSLGTRSMIESAKGAMVLHSNYSIYLLSSGLTQTSNVPLRITANGAVTVSSSARRYKENITQTYDAEINPDNLLNVGVYQFNYKDEYKDKAISLNNKELSIMADDIAEKFPCAAIYNKDGTIQSWDERPVISAMLKLIQEQNERINALERRLGSDNSKI